MIICSSILSGWVCFILQEVMKIKANATTDDKRADHDNPDVSCEMNGDDKTESLCSPPVNVEHDYSLCEEMDNLGGEPLVDNSLPCVGPRASKKSKVEGDEIHKNAAGNYFCF
jgi:tRNA-dihydrouridine synthase 3